MISIKKVYSSNGKSVYSYSHPKYKIRDIKTGRLYAIRMHTKDDIEYEVSGELNRPKKVGVR